MDLILKIFLVWILIAGTEVIHGILRARLLAPMVGDLRSRQIGVFSGCLLVFLIAWYTFDWMQIQTEQEALIAGAAWFMLMLAFELALGHFVFKFSWKWLFDDFNIFRGRLLLLGMLFLGFTPLLIRHMK